MRLQLLAIALVGCVDATPAAPAAPPAPPPATVPPSLASVVRDGDVVLQRSTSSQAEALREATGSPYTHVGLVFLRDGAPAVLEAVEPVRWTPLDAWAARGRDGTVVALRLRDASRLTPPSVAALRAAAEAHLGRPYDPLFQWSDDRIYCSELVYKAYRSALGVEVGERAPLGSFDLSGRAVRRLIERRMQGRVDAAEPVVAPASMLGDPDLVVVFSDDPEVAVGTP